jgi:hypothetical protein
LGSVANSILDSIEEIVIVVDEVYILMNFKADVP